MTIAWNPDAREWHLHNGGLSIVLAVLENGWIGQLHAGAPLDPGSTYRHLYPPFPGYDNRMPEPVPLAVPVPGVGDFRVPGLVVETREGATALDLRYATHRILAGKPALPATSGVRGPLPASYVDDEADAETLEIDIADAQSRLTVTLRWTLFAHQPVVARSMTLANEGWPVTVRTAMSATLDLPDADWTWIQLSGIWARERHIVERPLAPGRVAVSSTRGGSGPEHNPFVALRRPTTTEATGEAWGAVLAWSGNFLAEAEVDPFGTTRLRIGEHPDTFAWRLAHDGLLTTPEALIAWSDSGLGGLSDALHAVLRGNMARGPWRDAERPILLNNWEGTYFSFDHDRLVAMAGEARSMGIELFVLDDGWFGARNDDVRGLGDWTVNREKLRLGLTGLADEIHGMGLRFGLWIEPEMVNADSDLFRAHPEWAVGVPGRRRTEQRHQLVLDLTIPGVVDHLFEVIAASLADARVDYVKWDWNRFISEPWTPSLPPDRQGEFFHRYVYGLYELYDRLVARFPDVLFESCASGGARFDAGLLPWAPQAWTSDDTDAVERLRIQYGTSLAYPVSSMGAHVSAIPNHQTGRTPSLDFRAAVAMFGTFGYELDPAGLSEAERAQVRRQVAFFRERRGLISSGTVARLRSPFAGGGASGGSGAGLGSSDGNEAAWMVTAPSGDRALAAFYRVLFRPLPVRDRLRLRGLDPAARYAVTRWTSFDGPDLTFERGGDELMRVGIAIEPPDGEVVAGENPDGVRIVRHDFTFRLFDIVRISDGARQTLRGSIYRA